MDKYEELVVWEGCESGPVTKDGKGSTLSVSHPGVTRTCPEEAWVGATPPPTWRAGRETSPLGA